MPSADLASAVAQQAKHYQDIADSLCKVSAELANFPLGDFEKMEEAAKSAEDLAPNALVKKGWPSYSEVGAKLLPTLDSTFGLHPLQMLVCMRVRSYRGDRIQLLELLDEGPAAQVGYARCLKLLMTKWARKKLEKTPGGLQILKVAFSAIMKPLDAPILLASSLDDGHLIIKSKIK